MWLRPRSSSSGGPYCLYGLSLIENRCLPATWVDPSQTAPNAIGNKAAGPWRLIAAAVLSLVIIWRYRLKGWRDTWGWYTGTRRCLVAVWWRKSGWSLPLIGRFLCMCCFLSCCLSLHGRSAQWLPGKGSGGVGQQPAENSQGPRGACPQCFFWPQGPVCGG